MTDTTPRLALQELIASQAQKHVTMNADLIQLDGVVDCYLLGNGTNTPPGSPADGDMYIVGGSPTGDWTGQAGKIAYALDGDWQYILPFKGMLAWDNANTQLIFYNGSAWKDLGTINVFSYLKFKPVAFSALPSASAAGQGATAYVTDLSSTTRGATASGGGSGKGLVTSNGTNWIVV